MLIRLLLFVPDFFFSTDFLFRLSGAAALGRPEIPHDQQQSQIPLLAPQQDGTKQGERCSHTTWSLDEPRVAFLWM